jgi:hypothetical protein
VTRGALAGREVELSWRALVTGCVGVEMELELAWAGGE